MSLPTDGGSGSELTLGRSSGPSSRSGWGKEARPLAGLDASSRTALLRAYGAYCRREAAGLLGLIPPEEVRAFYRRARAWAEGTGSVNEKDPMANALAYCRHLLPLPPFPVWCRDFLANRGNHLESIGSDPPRDPGEGPFPLHARRFRGEGGEEWVASLHVLRRGGGWRGFLRFDGPGGMTGRTAHVFREELPAEIQERFESFHPHTLHAFLRSAVG